MLNEPAVDKAFFGREDVLQILEKRVNALKGGYRQNVALTGQMLAGKSSILYQFLYSLKDSFLIPVYIEVVEEPFAAFADRFIATLLYNYLASLDYGREKDLTTLIKTAEPLIPRTIYAIRKVKSDLSKRKLNDAYRKLLDLTSTLRKETGKSCIVILDEFHNLEFFKIKRPYLDFGKIIMIQKDTMYIVSSSQKNTIKKILSEKLALLYGNFEVIEVSGFDSKTAQGFLREKMQGVALAKNYADYIIDFTERTPFYLDVISRKIIEIANARRVQSVDRETLVEAFLELMYNTSGTINQYFTNNIMSLLEKRLRADYLDVLIALAHGHNKLPNIAKWFNKKSPSGLNKKLAELVELDMVYKNGSFYEMHDKVFKFWLRTVYHRKKTALVDDVVNMAGDFKKSVNDDVDAYISESGKGVSERMKELFLLFNGESVEIERKTRRLPRFTGVDIQPNAATEDVICNLEAGKSWVCRIHKTKVEEIDLYDFLKSYYPMRDRIARGICVALEGIDENALLLAKEKGMWVWGLKSVNGLLRLYKKRDLIANEADSRSL